MQIETNKIFKFANRLRYITVDNLPIGMCVDHVNKEYDKNNPEKVFNRHHRRKVLKENQGNGITKEAQSAFNSMKSAAAKDGISLKINKRYLWIEIRAYFGQIWIIIRIT